MQVKAAFRALGSIQSWEDLTKVDDTHADFEVDLYETIFVSHEAEVMLLEALPLPTGMDVPWLLMLRSPLWPTHASASSSKTRCSLCQGVS